MGLGYGAGPGSWWLALSRFCVRNTFIAVRRPHWGGAPASLCVCCGSAHAAEQGTHFLVASAPSFAEPFWCRAVGSSGLASALRSGAALIAGKLFAIFACAHVNTGSDLLWLWTISHFTASRIDTYCRRARLFCAPRGRDQRYPDPTCWKVTRTSHGMYDACTTCCIRPFMTYAEAHLLGMPHHRPPAVSIAVQRVC